MRVSAIIYGEKSNIIRRIVSSDTLNELFVHTTSLQDGEKALVINPDDPLTQQLLINFGLRNEVPNLKVAYSILYAANGVNIEDDRCFVIDNETGDIEGVVLADPNIDVIEGKTLYQHLEADVGLELDDNGEFYKPLGEV